MKHTLLKRTLICGISLFVLSTNFLSEANAALILSLSGGGASSSLEFDSDDYSIGSHTVSGGSLLYSGFSLTYNGSFGDYSVAVSTGVSNSSLDLSPALLNLHVMLMSVGIDADAITISITDTAYTTPEGTGMAFTSLDGAGLAPGATLMLESFVDGALVHTLTQDDYGTTSSIGGITTVAPFELSLVATLDHPDASGGIVMSGFSTSISVPEPNSLALLGIGILAIGFATLKRRPNKLNLR